MTREDIIKAMGESGVGTMLLGVQHDKAVERLTRFAALVAAAEREACAKVCEDVPAGKYDTPEFWREGVAYTCAAAIRARSKA
jgi:hypothetical protein